MTVTANQASGGDEPDPAAEPNPLWNSRNRATTIGMLLLATMAAFEHLGVSTAVPRMLSELNGTELYSWPFTSFLAASVVATVLSGRLSDRFGPSPVLVVGPLLFLAGLLVSGLAGSMPLLLAGRALQGLGLGGHGAAIYVLIARIYPERSRPAFFGMLAVAWVMPAVVGPTIAGLVTQYLGWRWVFLGLVPLTLIGLALLVPAIRRFAGRQDGPPGRPAGAKTPLAALAAAAGISALSWAAQHPSSGALWLGLAGIAALVPALRVLLPAGTLRARLGLPRVVLARGLAAGAFFGVEAYLPLTLTSVHGYPPALAGLPLTVAAIGWSSASYWQGRHPDLSRVTLLRRGFTILAAALAAMVLIAPQWGPHWLAAPLWMVAGAGMGLVFPSISVLNLRLSAPNERGFAASAAQVCDLILAAGLIGLGGVLLVGVASAAQPTAALVPLDLLMAAVAVLGAVLFRPGVERSALLAPRDPG